ncbi:MULTISPECIES: NAD kinase [unclassified Leifsonia]|uniref:NAD kinase n=1 Tax=unclassified Leifsonia TaxID=2663824 RepID=UPI0006F35867|nr:MULTISPECIES: NAD kinase [unclassified Leifsonia]KQX06316.1 NAD kinase [Leifsonia sp. Root1293]KRA10600.1 NAD kinase [Leifsonia sp. Root60]
MVESGFFDDGSVRAVADARPILVVAHTGRADSLAAALDACRQLTAAGALPVLPGDQWDDLHTYAPELDGQTERLGSGVRAEDLELVVVLGGDGTILRAAELVRDAATPILGVNLGHVGFLAESERDDLGEAIGRGLARDYVVEERMTLSVRVKQGDEIVHEDWALNEATVEKASRERMLEVAIEVDRRPLSTFGCDGVVLSTPTGSTAYAFSGGGPVVWPTLDAMLMVPLSAHALFARPIVVGPDSAMAIELLRRTQGSGVLWCDGRRSFELQPGARVVVRRSPVPVRLARLHPGPFTDRLVNKFQLPVTGWRGPDTSD